MKLEVQDIINKQTVQLEIDDKMISGDLKIILNKEILYLGPGLIDLQVNGYKGIDFNDNALSVDKVKKAALELLKDGVTGFLPTLITNDPSVIEKNLQIFKQAIEEDPFTECCIPGIHLEGPFISPNYGSRGAHPEEWIQKPDIKFIEKWQNLSGNRIRLITFSPEYEGSTDFIKFCTESGIKVSTGHTSATVEQLLEAVSSGVTLSTHLGNGMSKEIHRHRNILYEQITDDRLYASIITDGHHLSKSLLKIILRSKPGKVFLVSDSTKFTGMRPGYYKTVIGGKIELAKNRRLSIKDNEEYLAGSASSLADCVNYLCGETLLSLSEAWSMASILPYSYLYGREPNSISNGDFVLFTQNSGNIKIILTSKGERLYSSL